VGDIVSAGPFQPFTVPVSTTPVYHNEIQVYSYELNPEIDWGFVDFHPSKPSTTAVAEGRSVMMLANKRLQALRVACSSVAAAHHSAQF